MGQRDRGGTVLPIAVIAGFIVLAILVVGTIIIGQSARSDTEEAVRKVSLLYLDELAGRREQVVEYNLNRNIETIETAIRLMTEEDLSDSEHLQKYQARMKELYKLDKFAFVDTNGLIYTALGTQTNIDAYSFDHRTLNAPEISILNPDSTEKKVVIAIPVDMAFMGETLKV